MLQGRRATLGGGASRGGGTRTARARVPARREGVLEANRVFSPLIREGSGLREPRIARTRSLPALSPAAAWELLDCSPPATGGDAATQQITCFQQVTTLNQRQRFHPGHKLCSIS